MPNNDYVSHGAAILFAVLEDMVLSLCMQRRHHQEFIRYLNAINVAVSVDELVYVIFYTNSMKSLPVIYKYLKVMARPEWRKRWIFYYTITSASYADVAGILFLAMIRHRLPRGVSHCGSTSEKR